LDVNKGIAKISPFFFPAFFDSKNGKQFKDSLLFNQEERAKHPPDIRSHTSNAFREEEFWNEWDDATSKMRDLEDLDPIPEHMDTTIRPIIARCKSPTSLDP
jgi:TRAP-type mannitol/chloroaromatic compound transport system substrate-binding protein